MSEAALRQSSQQQRLEAEWATMAPRVLSRRVSAASAEERSGGTTNRAAGKRRRKELSAEGKHTSKAGRTARASGPVTPCIDPDSASSDATSANTDAQIWDGAAATVAAAAAAAAADDANSPAGFPAVTDTQADEAAQASQADLQPSVPSPQPHAGSDENRDVDECTAEVTIRTCSQSSADEAVDRAARASWTVPAHPTDACTSSQSTNGDPDAEAANDADPDDGDSSYDEGEHEDFEEDSELEHGVDFDLGELAQLADTSERSQLLNAEFDRSRPRLQIGLQSTAQTARHAVKGQLKLCLGGSANTNGSTNTSEKQRAPTSESKAKIHEKRETFSCLDKKVHPFFSRAASKPGDSADQQASSSQQSESGLSNSQSPAPAVRAEDAGQHWSAFWQARVGSYPGSKAAAAVLRQGGQGARRRMSAAAAASSSGSRFAQCPCCGRSVAVTMLDEHLDRCGVAAASPAHGDIDPTATEHQQQAHPMGASRTSAAATSDAGQPHSIRHSKGASGGTSSAGMISVQSNVDGAQSAGEHDATYARCPICNKRLAVAYMNMHLDLECSGEIEDERSSPHEVVTAAAHCASASSSSCSAAVSTTATREADSGGWASVAKEWSARWDALGRCRITQLNSVLLAATLLAHKLKDFKSHAIAFDQSLAQAEFWLVLTSLMWFL